MRLHLCFMPQSCLQTWSHSCPACPSGHHDNLSRERGFRFLWDTRTGPHDGQFCPCPLSLTEIIAVRWGAGFLGSGGDSLEPGSGSLELKSETMG